MAVTDALSAELIAVIVAVTAGSPRILTVDAGRGLPSGGFEGGDRSLQSTMRDWVEQRTRRRLGFVEQLYTFADRDRARREGMRVISVSYLGLAREEQVQGDGAGWTGWYRYFPWEDQRAGTPPLIADLALNLGAWADTSAKRRRVRYAFGLDGQGWNEEFSLERYELLYEASLVPERHRADGVPGEGWTVPGDAMAFDHRRILATAVARLRAKIKYRPVFFELMPESFTLSDLQRTVEALAGRRLHTQNFRRLIDQQALVEETGEIAAGTGGRPAKLFRYRRDVQETRALSGTKLPIVRS